MRRNPIMKMRLPETTVIGKWFHEYKSLLKTLGIKVVPSLIWNNDESDPQDFSSHCVVE